MNKPKISVLIPVYNESKTIEAVINTVHSSEYVDQIICINDASTDSTEDILRDIPYIKTITLQTNQGKASAIEKGIRQSSGDIILMIDGDLIGLTPKHIELLLKPLIERKYDYSIGWILGGFVNALTKPLTGERAYFKKDLLPLLNEMVNIGFGLELFLNYHFRKKRGAYIELKNMRQPFKEEKHTLGTAIRLNLHALSDITSIILKSSNPLKFFINAYIPYYLKGDKGKLGTIRSNINKFRERLAH